MTDERCPITELHPTSCAHCRRIPDLIQPPVPHRARHQHDRVELITTIAGWAGNCANCGEHFLAGATIHRLSGETGWLGECCDGQP